jgi:hypothetical protein
MKRKPTGKKFVQRAKYRLKKFRRRRYFNQNRNTEPTEAFKKIVTISDGQQEREAHVEAAPIKPPKIFSISQNLNDTIRSLSRITRFLGLSLIPNDSEIRPSVKER